MMSRADALKKLSEELNSNKDPKFPVKFSYAPEHQTEALVLAKKLVSDGTHGFNNLVDGIVRRRTRACEVCDPEVKKSYEKAMVAEINDIKFDALLNHDVRAKVDVVLQLKEKFAYENDHPKRRFFFGKWEAEDTSDKLANAQVDLNKFLNEIKGSSEKMADAVKKYKCVD